MRSWIRATRSLAGVVRIAKVRPKGFILTTVLGIVGAVVATYLGQAVGWYQAGESAGFIASIVGAIIVLVIWGLIAPRLERT